jgi:hypothetical protein
MSREESYMREIRDGGEIHAWFGSFATGLQDMGFASEFVVMTVRLRITIILLNRNCRRVSLLYNYD